MAIGPISTRFPKLIVEVLSPSTSTLDLRDKARGYLAIPTLGEYLVIDSPKRFVVLHRRADDRVETTWPTSAIELASISAVLSLNGVYDGILVRA
ncbi:MAG: Uma2 family endonuclease [Candidatus Eremiobacteraeota bacterium]|nr:Uma2 family endonuclease [Candidatus Eremiobacteraeota bacterium]MBC5804261.1 Uma2 family endonuclease [Candidatus Eremiobacteraeota bacterium]MBC5820903.1 Uma2 family endonuclease [Candidatus Eremiobacteraeota bacterium]